MPVKKEELENFCHLIMEPNLCLCKFEKFIFTSRTSSSKSSVKICNPAHPLFPTHTFLLEGRRVEVFVKVILANESFFSIYYSSVYTVKKAVSECAKFRCWQRWHRTKRRGSRNFPTPTSFGSRLRCPHRNFPKLFLQCMEPILFYLCCFL